MSSAQLSFLRHRTQKFKKKAEFFFTIKKHPPEVFHKKSVLEYFSKFTGKHQCQGLFFNRPATLLKRRLWHRCFSVNFANFSRTPFLQDTSGWRFLTKISMRNFWEAPIYEVFRLLSAPAILLFSSGRPVVLVFTHLTFRTTSFVLPKWVPPRFCQNDQKFLVLVDWSTHDSTY